MWCWGRNKLSGTIYSALVWSEQIFAGNSKSRTNKTNEAETKLRRQPLKNTRKKWTDNYGRLSPHHLTDMFFFRGFYSCFLFPQKFSCQVGQSVRNDESMNSTLLGHARSDKRVTTKQKTRKLARTNGRMSAKSNRSRRTGSCSRVDRGSSMRLARVSLCVCTHFSSYSGGGVSDFQTKPTNPQFFFPLDAKLTDRVI
jgi:hypothetical protein